MASAENKGTGAICTPVISFIHRARGEWHTYTGGGELLSVRALENTNGSGWEWAELCSSTPVVLLCVRGNRQEAELGFGPLSSSPVWSLGDEGGKIKSNWLLNVSAQKLKTL